LGGDGYRSLEHDLIDARRVFVARCDIWGAVASAGPQGSIAPEYADVLT